MIFLDWRESCKWDSWYTVNKTMMKYTRMHSIYHSDIWTFEKKLKEKRKNMYISSSFLQPHKDRYGSMPRQVNVQRAACQKRWTILLRVVQTWKRLSSFLSARRLMWKPHRGSMQMTSIFPWRLFKGMKNSRKLKSTHETPSFLILSSKVCALQRGESAIVARRLTCAILEANGFYFPWLKGKPFQRSALQ